jgi:hypothetical protein
MNGHERTRAGIDTGKGWFELGMKTDNIGKQPVNNRAHWWNFFFFKSSPFVA